MERRVIIAIIVSFAIVYSYQLFFVKRPPTTAEAPAQVAAGQQTAGSAATAAATNAATATAPTAEVLLGESAERDVTVETRLVSAVFTNRGARLKSWRLKEYQDRNHEPLELVSTELATTQPLPFTLKTADERVNTAINNGLFSLRAPPSGASDPNLLVFEYRDSSGVAATKEFRLSPDKYTVSLTATVSSNNQQLPAAIVWGPGLGDNDSQTGRASVLPGGLHSVAGKVSRLTAKNVAETPLYDQDFEYAGIDDHYFTSFALKPGRAKVTYQSLSVPGQQGAEPAVREFMGYTIEPSNNGQVVFYVGPKEFDSLADVDRNLVKAINFGMFSVLVVPMLRSLNWIHNYVGNYGWAIVILTGILNLVLFPLNHKSVVSMRKMQEIQPEAKAIQERYSKLKATDPAKQKMNQELMALYRERGVNPASGCIPILLTLPIFLAFYALLTTAIELRGAPFIGWIHDLSQPDPYYVLPILVGLSQFATQWMTPQPGADPAQQRMMLIMPLVLTFVFFTSPAGSLLYWFVQSVWRVGQQTLTNKLIGPPNVRVARPAAERRVKRVGAGKTEGAAKEN
jgi:YidC/Oxa1 family membrane protein insertase